ncbi:MAG: hypothetical protein IT285_16015 [Bdellovibrionales bacterium]|nr:hypothetical protein [Bdellovibrionales bacterium]
MSQGLAPVLAALSILGAAEARAGLESARRPSADLDGDGALDFRTVSPADRFSLGREVLWLRRGSSELLGRMSETSTGTRLSWDLDRDGRADRDETLSEGLLRRRFDRDSDGYFEEIEEVITDGEWRFVLESRYSKATGRYETVASRRSRASELTPESAYPLGLDRAGTDGAMCIPEATLSELRAIPELARFYAGNVPSNIPVVNVKGRQYWQVNGIRIPADCPSASEVLIAYERGISQGMACLRRMSGTLPGEAFTRLQALVSRQDPERWVTVTCMPAEEGGPEAFASLPPRPPTLSVRSPFSEGGARAQATLFHEYLHLVGYSHAEGYEMGDTCGSCCFGAEPGWGPGVLTQACNLCNTSNADQYSQSYVEELARYYASSGQQRYEQDLFMFTLARTPTLKWARLGLLRTSLFPASMRGAYATRLLQRTDLTPAERTALMRIAAARPELPEGTADLGQRLSGAIEEVMAALPAGSGSAAWNTAVATLEQSIGRLPPPASLQGRAYHEYRELVGFRASLIQQLQGKQQARMLEIARAVPAWANLPVPELVDLMQRKIRRHPAGTPFGASQQENDAALQIRELLTQADELERRVVRPHDLEAARVRNPEPPAAAR